MEKIYYSSFYSPFLKNVFVASTPKGLCMVDFLTSERRFLKELKSYFAAEIVKDDRKNGKAVSQIKQYLKGRLKRFDLSLDLRGTPFQKRVWLALGRIPYGKTQSYQDVGKSIGHPKAFRAVGNANGRNPLPIVLPCHRVIESNGGLGGFGHGIKVKKQLLDFEKTYGQPRSKP